MKMHFTQNLPTTDAEWAAFNLGLTSNLPESVRELYVQSNGGRLEVDGRTFKLWTLGELLGYNEGYEVEEFAPEIFLIGTDFCGNALVVERATGAVYEVPFIPMTLEDSLFLMNCTELLGTDSVHD